MINIGVIICEIKRLQQEQEFFNKMCAALTKEQSDKLKKAALARRKEHIAHAKALEIANASRARNFWGD
jgi:hypothetical protein